MLVIRFSRIGKKNKAQYRLVLAERTFPIKGKFIEILGSYNPHSKKVSLREDRIKEWLAKGAGCSDSVFNLLISKGIIKDKKRFIPLAPKKSSAAEGDKSPEEKNEDKKSEEDKPENKPSGDKPANLHFS